MASSDLKDVASAWPVDLHSSAGNSLLSVIVYRATEGALDENLREGDERSGQE